MNGPRQPAPMQGRPMPGQRPGEEAPKKGRRRKESDFFYVNRKGVCFLMFVVFLLAIIVVLGSGVLGMMPSMKENSAMSMIFKFTAVFEVKDLTPESERTPTVDEDGNEVAYTEKSQYVTFMELILGSVNGLTGGSADAGEAAAQADEGDGEVEEAAGGFDMSTPFYDGYVAMADAKGISDDITVTLMKFLPFALVALVVFALWYMIKAFLAMFGKRVFKNFGLGSILMLICAAIPIVVGISMISIYAAEAGGEVSLQFGAIGDYFLGAFKTGLKIANDAASAEAAEGALTTLPFYMGFGQLILLGLPVVTLLLSFGARRKIPYSIFD